MPPKLLIVSDRALLETRPEHRYPLVNQALRNFTLRFTDQTVIDEFWWGANPEESLKKMNVTDPVLFWKSYNRQDTTEFRKQLTKAYPDVTELEALRKKKVRLILLAHDSRELAQVSLDKLPKMDNVICVPRDTLHYAKKVEEEVHGALKRYKVKTQEALLISNMEEDLAAAEKNKIKAIYIERKGAPKLRRKGAINTLSDIVKMVDFRT